MCFHVFEINDSIIHSFIVLIIASEHRLREKHILQLLSGRIFPTDILSTLFLQRHNPCFPACLSHWSRSSVTRSHQSEPARGAGRRGLEGAASGNAALATKERRHCPIWLTNIENGEEKKKKNQRGEIKCGGAEGTGGTI